MQAVGNGKRRTNEGEEEEKFARAAASERWDKEICEAAEMEGRTRSITIHRRKKEL